MTSSFSNNDNNNIEMLLRINSYYTYVSNMIVYIRIINKNKLDVTLPLVRHPQGSVTRIVALAGRVCYMFIAVLGLCYFPKVREPCVIYLKRQTRIYRLRTHAFVSR